MTSRQRFAIIGLDGANLETIEEGARKGLLPNLSRVLENGCRAPLQSIPTMNTIPAWKVMVTGKNPARLGYFDFLTKLPNSYQQVMFNATLVREKELWDYAQDVGYRVGVFNVPGTYPPRPVKGVMVTGLMTPSTDVDFTYPRDFRNDVARLTNNAYMPDIVRPVSHDPRKELQLMRDVTHMHATVGSHIITITEPDFFMGVLTITDKVQHHFWHVIDEKHAAYNPQLTGQLGNPIMDMYAEADAVVGEWLAQLGPDTNVLIVSDHGAHGIDGMLMLNQWLLNEGLLKLKKDVRDVVRNVSMVHKLFGTLPNIVKTMLRPFIRQGIGQSFQSNLDALFDMSRTQAFATTSGQLYINLKGREPEGIVKPEEYDTLIARIRQGLGQIKNPRTGENLKIEVIETRKIWDGPFIEHAPDLIVNMDKTNYDRGMNMNPKGKLFVHFGEDYHDFSGVHKRMGMLLAIGPQIKQGAQLEEMHLLDVAPTALHFMGLPIPRDMDGKVQTSLFHPDSEAARRQPVYQDASSQLDTNRLDYSDDEADTISERLKDLGYLE